MSTLRVARLEMDAEVVGNENCVERRIDNFGDSINGDHQEGTIPVEILILHEKLI